MTYQPTTAEMAWEREMMALMAEEAEEAEEAEYQAWCEGNGDDPDDPETRRAWDAYIEGMVDAMDERRYDR